MTKSPKEIAEKDLDKVVAGYGRRCYYSYDSNASTHYAAKSDDSPSSH